MHYGTDIIWAPTACHGHVQERLKALKKGYGSKEIGNVTAEKVIGGMRGITVRTLLSTYVAERVTAVHTKCAACYGPPLQSLLRETCRQGMLWETSLLDPEEGIKFRGYSIPELQARHTGT